MAQTRLNADSNTFTVPLGELHKSSDVTGLTFGRSDELLETVERTGQARAAEAIRFGITTNSDGYNVFIMGPAGSHRHALAENMLAEEAATRPVPDDWCYVNNFAEPERPRALRFPAGRGIAFRDDMRTLIDDMRIAIPATFESEDYRNQLKAIEEETDKEMQTLWQSLDELAGQENIGVMRTPDGYVLAPLKDGKVIGDKDFEKLPEPEQQKIKAAIDRLGQELAKRIEQLPQLRKNAYERIKSLNREFTAHAVGLLLKALKASYSSMPQVVDYLDEVEKDIIENADEFRESEPSPLPFLSRDSTRLFSRYEVNLVVNNEKAGAAPVQYEPNPSYTNVVGNIEHRAELGALVTDFSMVRCGALQRANGGFLILDIERILQRPFVWEALKQAMLEKKVRIESPAEMYGLTGTTTLRPEEIPLHVKIVLIGQRWLYYLLSEYDSEFSELCRVVADIDDEMPRNEANVRDFVLLAAGRIRALELLPFSRGALLRITDEGSRLAEDSERITTHLRSLDDLLIQSDHWARRRDAATVETDDVLRALEERIKRLNRVQTRIIEAIERNTLLIDTAGERVGQVNGLSIVGLGDFRFGHPVRITATTRIGNGDVVDIEREVELGGAIHSKGVMILSSALSARYSPDMPLSMAASVVFEQSYSAVEAIGGVNEKIEGFYEVCRSRGLDGSHGVVIPRDNVKHLMLREDVVKAVEEQRFHIYAVSHIDEAVEILTGPEAGRRGDDGQFPAGSVNQKVEAQLVDYACKRRDFGQLSESNDGG